MNTDPFRPYLIIPKLIEQPTWGGSYIAQKKNWTNRSFAEKKIGQSYELYGKSLLSTSIFDSSNPSFAPEFESCIVPEHVALQQVIDANPEGILGPSIAKKFHTLPILIKFTQALGNSFQLHTKPADQSDRWKSKAESWYYFEKGYVTLGLKDHCDLAAYKQTCVDIDQFMKNLSQQIIQKHTSLEDASQKAKQFIHEKNPWQFVNVLEIPKNGIVDLSSGGIHHSWEENRTVCPEGNILFEVQEDVDDDSSTIRSFDQGKFKNDGTIRTIQIDDYFSHLDREKPANASVQNIPTRATGAIFHTPYYSMDSITVNKRTEMKTQASFDVLFVQKGFVTVGTPSLSFIVTEGHSIFIPWGVHSYVIDSKVSSIVLKTYIDERSAI